jgi:hypothetical protein
MKANHKEIQVTSASPVRYQNSATRSISVLSPFLRHLTMSHLAFTMFVALALLSPIRGKGAETRESASVSPLTSGVIVNEGQRIIQNLDFTEKETLRRHLAKK